MPLTSSQIICSIGGNVAENSGGVHCLKYGVTTNHVLGLKLVLLDGSIVDGGTNSGNARLRPYLCVLVPRNATEITLRILKTSESICVLLADFTSIEAAGAAVSDIISAGIIPAGMEMMDNPASMPEDVVATGCYPRDAAAILLVEIDGLEVEVAANKQRIAAICKQNGARSITTANDPEKRLKLWKAQGILQPLVISVLIIVQDGVIPRTQLPLCCKRLRISARNTIALLMYFMLEMAIIRRFFTTIQCLGALEQKSWEEKFLSSACKWWQLSEHGIGADKRCYMPNMFTPSDLETQWVRGV